MSCKPWQPFILCPMKFNQTDQKLIDVETKVFKTKGIIEEVTGYDNDEFYSNIFTRPKKDGTVRVILNLKRFNDCMEKIHFKMETLKAAITNIQQGDYFGSIDLKDAYFSVPIADCDRKYLRFVWNDKKYQFYILPQGLACSPRVFTKLLKPVYASLRKSGHFSTPYIDDSLLKGQTYNDCFENINDTVLVVDKLGFTVHPDKSVLIPTQKISFLGFELNSVNMTIRLTPERDENLLNYADLFLNKHHNNSRVRKIDGENGGK